MPQWPHAYTLLSWSETREQAHSFQALARAIFEQGYDVKIGRRTYRYLDIGEYKYWSMDPTPEATDLINRARHDGKGPRDGIVLDYVPLQAVAP